MTAILIMLALLCLIVAFALVQNHVWKFWKEVRRYYRGGYEYGEVHFISDHSPNASCIVDARRHVRSGVVQCREHKQMQWYDVNSKHWPHFRQTIGHGITDAFTKTHND